MKKLFLIAIGTISLTLGVIGIVVPGLPTTVFLLFTAACYARSSDKLYNWLLDHKLFGKLIKDYNVHKAMPLKSKIVALVMMWTAILTSCIFFIQNEYVIILVFVAGIAGTIAINSVKTKKNSMKIY